MFREICPVKLFPFIMVLESQSPNVYLVGGAVRDILCDKTPHDFDLVTDTPIDTLAEVFQDGGFSVALTGVSHFVLNVSLGGYTVEISNFRKDTCCDGRHAVVEIGTIYDDAHRRDFTINALYINTRTGQIVDPTGMGLGDINSRTLRFVGKPKDRIREDYLRGWRAMRFAQRGFTIEPKSLRAVREMWGEIYKNSTPERVRNEMEKMITP
jgi:tRNA nucleotidyltransferase/poly(A) polymerase